MTRTIALLVPLFFLAPVWGVEEPPQSVTPSEPEKAPTSPAPTGPITPIPSDGWQQGGQVGQAPPEKPSTALHSVSRPGLASFQLNGVLLLQSGGSNALTGQFAWTPQMAVDKYTLRGEFGVSVPKNTLGDLFLAFNYELLFRSHLNSNMLLDLGGGGQTWTGARGVTQPIISAQISRRYDTHAVVDLIFLGYSYFFTTPRIHTLKLGIGFNL